MERNRKTKKNDGSPNRASSRGRTQMKPPPSPASRILTSRALQKGKFPSPKSKKFSQRKSGGDYHEESSNSTMEFTFGMSNCTLDTSTFLKNLAHPGWHKDLDETFQTVPVTDLTGDQTNDSNFEENIESPRSKRKRMRRQRVSTTEEFRRAAAAKSSVTPPPRESQEGQVDNGRGDSSSVSSESSDDNIFEDSAIPDNDPPKPRRTRASNNFSKIMSQQRGPSNSPKVEPKNLNNTRNSVPNNEPEYVVSESPPIPEEPRKTRRPLKRVSASVYKNAVSDLKFSDSPKNDEKSANPPVYEDDSVSDVESPPETTNERKRKQPKISFTKVMKSLGPPPQSDNPPTETQQSSVAEDTSESENEDDDSSLSESDLEDSPPKKRNVRKGSDRAFERAMGPVRKSNSTIPRSEKSLSPTVEESDESDEKIPIVEEPKKRRSVKKDSLSTFNNALSSMGYSDSSTSKGSKSFATILEDNESEIESPIPSPKTTRHSAKSDSFNQIMEQYSNLTKDEETGLKIPNTSLEGSHVARESLSGFKNIVGPVRHSHIPPESQQDSSPDVSDDGIPESPPISQKKSFVVRDSLSAFKNIRGRVRHSNIPPKDTEDIIDSNSEDSDVEPDISTEASSRNRTRVTKDSSKAFMDAMKSFEKRQESSVSNSDNNIPEPQSTTLTDNTSRKSNRDSLNAFKNIKKPVRHSHIPLKNKNDSISEIIEPESDIPTESVSNDKTLGVRESMSAFNRLGPVRHSDSPLVSTRTTSKTSKSEQNSVKNNRRTFTKETSNANKSPTSPSQVMNKSGSVDDQQEASGKNDGVTVTLTGQSSPRKSQEPGSLGSDIEVEVTSEDIENFQATKNSIPSQSSTENMSISSSSISPDKNKSLSQSSTKNMSISSSPDKNKTLNTEKEIESQNVTPKKSPQVFLGPRQSPRFKVGDSKGEKTPSVSRVETSPTRQSPRFNSSAGKNSLTKEITLESSVGSQKDEDSEPEDSLTNIEQSFKVKRPQKKVSMSVFAEAVADLKSAPTKIASTTKPKSASLTNVSVSLTRQLEQNSSTKNTRFSASDLQQAFELLETKAAQEPEEEHETEDSVSEEEIDLTEPEKTRKKKKFSLFDFKTAMESLDVSSVTQNEPEPRLIRSSRSRLDISATTMTSVKESPHPPDSRSSSRVSARLSTSVTSLSLLKKQTTVSDKGDTLSQSYNILTRSSVPNTTGSRVSQKSFLRKRYTLMDLQQTMEAVRSPSIIGDTSVQSLQHRTFTEGKFSIRDIERAVTTLRAETADEDDDDNDTTGEQSTFSLPKPRKNSSTRNSRILDVSETRKDHQDSQPALLSIQSQSENTDASTKKISLSTPVQVPNLTLDNQSKSMLNESSHQAPPTNTSVASLDISTETLPEEPLTSRKRRSVKPVSLADFQKAMQEFPSPTTSEKSKHTNSLLDSSAISNLSSVSSQSEKRQKGKEISQVDFQRVMDEIHVPSNVDPPITTGEVESVQETSDDSFESESLEEENAPASFSANNKKMSQPQDDNIEGESEGREQENINTSLQEVPHVDEPEENINLIDLSSDDEHRETPSPNDTSSQVQIPDTETTVNKTKPDLEVSPSATSSKDVSDDDILASQSAAESDKSEEQQDDTSDPSSDNDEEEEDNNAPSPQSSSSEEEELAEETAPQDSSSSDEDEMETNEKSQEENGNASDASTILGDDDPEPSVHSEKNNSFKKNTPAIEANFSGVLSTAESAKSSKQQARRDLTKAFSEKTESSSKNKSISQVNISSNMSGVSEIDPKDKSAVTRAIKNYGKLVAACKPSITDKISKQYAKKTASVNTVEKKAKKTADIIPEKMFHGKVYRKPRLVRPKPWVTTKFYKLLEDNFTKKKPGQARRLSEEYVKKLVPLVTEVMRNKTKLRESVCKVAKLLKKEDFVTDDYSFLNFSLTYLPEAFVSKAFPYKDGEPHSYLD